jgi:hypothetical protein
MDAQPAQDRRVLKRLRSEGSVDVEALSTTSVDDVDFDLLAHIPSIGRFQSNRQIDYPVHKSAFWIAQDRKTWHLKYPEMTQLQLDAFKAAAASRGEDFGPGKSPLWDLAMKYFPPTHRPEAMAADNTNDTATPATAQDATGLDAIPDTQDPRPRRAVQSEPTPSDKRVVAVLESSPESTISGLVVCVTESMVSWGRAFDNTRLFSPRSEARVPKYALRIILWGENFDPSKHPRPWNRQVDVDESSLHFYVATKATCGISVNGISLPSSNPQSPASPFEFWMRLHHNDTITVWETSDGTAKTELTFRCNWGGSGLPRPSNAKPSYVPPAIADRLDDLVIRTEKKIRSLIDHDIKLDYATRDVDARMLMIDQERERSRAFELKRQEACRALALRRNSPAPYGVHGDSGQATWLSQITNRTVAAFRTTSPTTSDLLREARR